MSHWSYSRCSACKNDRRQVMPDGPLDARIALIGESPGRQEDSSGIPFCGVSGQEQDETYFRLAGLDRADVFVTNCVQCRSDRGGMDVKPSDALVSACAANHLVEEILTVNPEVIVLAGATACSLIPGIDLELEHGFPRRARLWEWEGWVVPFYHPAAGLHRTSLMVPLLEDWERLGKWLRGEWQPPSAEVELTRHRYELLHGQLDGLRAVTAVDTESDEGRPYSIQWSGKAGKAYMLLADDRWGVGKFARWIKEYQPTLVFHNASHDLEQLDLLGIHPCSYRDTMQECYHLGNLPQGLKAAVYRVFGYRMTSYDEVVTPHSKAALEHWLSEALAHVSISMRTVELKQLKTKVREVTKPHEAEAVLRRVMAHLDSDYDPWQPPHTAKGETTARLIGKPWLEEVERAVGRMPRRSIIHAPIEQQVEYACGDADWTGRLAAWLEGERQRIVRQEWLVA